MSSKKRTFDTHIGDAPETLGGHPFYGINLDEYQLKFANAIWNPNKDIIFCNAAAGTGKTVVALGVANLLVQYGKYSEIIYLVSPTQEQKIGYRPGGTGDKMAPYFSPLYDAAVSLGINTYVDINECTDDWKSQGGGYISCMSPIFLRGRNITAENILIVDEAQNLYVDELRTVLSRVHDGTKIVVIGHAQQCDLYHNPQNSGFEPYIKHFSGKERCEVCELVNNHRGWVSKYADDLITGE